MIILKSPEYFGKSKNIQVCNFKASNGKKSKIEVRELRIARGTRKRPEDLLKFQTKIRKLGIT